MNPEMGCDPADLRATLTIESGHPAILACAARVTGSCTGDREKLARLFTFVRDSIRYNLFMISAFEEDFRASRVLEWGKGYCVQKAVLLASLARAAGIPGRLAFAKIKNHRTPGHIVQTIGSNVFPRHGYNQFFCEGRWVSAVAAFDRDLCESNGLPTVEFDGTADAVLPEKDLQGRPYVEYIEKYPPAADLPFPWIVPVISARFGPDKRPSLSRPADKGSDRDQGIADAGPTRE